MNGPEGACPPPAAAPPPLPELWSFQVRCTGVPPSKARHAPIRGKAKLIVSGARLIFSGKVSQPGTPLLCAAALTIVTFALVHVLAADWGCGVCLSFLIWLTIMNQVLKKHVVLAADASSGQALHDSRRGQTSVLVGGGRWVTFPLAEGDASTEANLLETLYSIYGPRFAEGRLPAMSLGEKVALWTLAILFGGSLLIGIIFALLAGR